MSANSQKRSFRSGLNEIPFISEGISEYSDFTVGLRARLLQKFDTGLLECRVVTVKIIGSQKQKNSATGLIADRSTLLVRGRLCE